MGLRLMLVTLGLWLGVGLRERTVFEALMTITHNLAAGVESDWVCLCPLWLLMVP